MVARPPRIAGAAAITALWLCLPASASAQVWEIDTYGNGEMLQAVLQGLALFAGPGGGLTGALKLAALIGLLALLVAMTGTALGGGRVAASFPYAAIVAGTVATLSTSTVPIAVVDKIAATSTIIGGIPLPIAIIGYFTSTLGSRITEQVEQAILPVDSERFMTHGLGWGPRVMQTTLEAQIQDPALRQDLDMYIQVCVSENFNSGHKTAKDLTQGTTAEQVLGDTNPAIPFVLPSQYLAPPPNQSCLDAWTNVLNPNLTAHATSQEILGFLAMKLGLPSYSDVLPAITDISGDLLKVSESATELLKLRFAVNQLLPSLQAMSAVGNQSAMVSAWALAEAQAQQTSSWLSTGLLLQQVLPVFHAALEFLFYGFLLLGLPLLMVMPRMILQIMQTALFLQLWPLAYVFGNLFLYTQVSKVSWLTGDTTQGLGLSLTATPAIQGSIQNAYAASGFPIMIGVLMLSGLIFGGGFALQKAIQNGPFQVGGAFGTAATLGNISVGNVSSEQRSLVPRAQLERDGFVDTVYGTLANPALLERRRGSFSEQGLSFGHLTQITPINGSGGSAEVNLGGGTSIAFDPGSGRAIRASLPISAATRESALSRGGSTLTIENAKMQQRATELQNARASNLDKTFTATQSHEASEQFGISEATREAFQRTASQEIGHALQSSEVGQEVRQHFINKGGQAGLDASLSILGSKIGPSGQISVTAQFRQGEEFTTTLSQDTSNKVLSQASESLGRTKEFQALQQEVARHGDSSLRALGFSEIQRATQSFNDATSKRNSVATTLEATQAFVAEIGGERGHLLLNALWNAHNPGVNFLEAVRNDTEAAKSFAAYLRGSLSSPEGLQNLATEAVGHLRTTGQFDQYLGTSASVESQRPAMPSAVGLKPAENRLLGSGFAEPVGHQPGPIAQDVEGKLRETDTRLEDDRKGLEQDQRRLDSGIPSQEEVNRGIQDRRTKTEGGALTATGEVAREVTLETVEAAKDAVVGIGGQFSAMFKSLEEGGRKHEEQAGGPTPKAQ